MSVQMKKYLIFIYFVLFALAVHADDFKEGLPTDTSQVTLLNKQGFDVRLTNPDQTVRYAKKALAIARKLNYRTGVAESYRIMGIGNFYLDNSDEAISNYLTAVNIFTQINDLGGQSKVYNNIGNLYRAVDLDLALEFYQKSLVIAEKLKDNQLMAPLYLNIGTYHYFKKSYNQALTYYNKSYDLYAKLKDSVNLVLCMHDKGLVYYYLNQYGKAEGVLLEANKEAKQLDLNVTVASVDFTIADLYIAQSKFSDAEKTIKEGLNYSKMIKNDKMEDDFKYYSYLLELKRKNYEQALYYLQDIYKKDSVIQLQNASLRITGVREQVKQQARQRENEFLLQSQAYDRGKFWGVAIVAGLLTILVGLLVSNVKRKAKTNSQLTALNAEVSRQKDNLDRINHHLEEIIDERTKDLQIKNKKLSEYSSYLSHQIRGPIATLKGLMNLEKEGLVDQPECIKMMNKCVSEIDDKIIEMSDMLHDPGRAGF